MMHSGCALPVHSPSMSRCCAGLQELSHLQRLEVLHVPCTDLHAVTRLAAQLPAVRSLDLLCSCSARAHQEAVGQLTLTAATSITELRLRACASCAADSVRRLQMPPRLQVLTAVPCSMSLCSCIFLCTDESWHADVRRVTDAG